MRKIFIIIFVVMIGFINARDKSSTPYIGEVIMMANNYAPVGFVPCDGRLLSVSEYTSLFSIIGTYYGGNGTTNFAVPDLRGRAMVGNGSGPGLSYKTIGQTGGTEEQALSEAMMAGHAHDINTESYLKGLNGSATTTAAGGTTIARAEVDVYAANAPNVAMKEGSVVMDGTESTENAGLGQQHYNMMPYNVINYYIATTGIYPTQSKTEKQGEE